MNRFLNPQLKKKGFKVFKFKDESIHSDIRKCINKYFNKSTSYYKNLELNKFRKIALKCQNSIIKLNIHERFAKSENKRIKKMLNGDLPLYETQLFLRAIRPINKNGDATGEAVDWHRETFYTNYQFVKHGINIWFPVKNVNKKNNLKFIEGSHMIDDFKIKRRKIKMTKAKKLKNPTKKFSVGHKLGFLYHPKKIISGVNLKKIKSMKIPEKSYSLFSTMLVHGNSQNYSDKIRFAIGFGFIPKSKMPRKKILDPRRSSTKIQNLLAYKDYG
jgi:ectoine hydroxylase-related dioxygenase (phytanoyl-CoA dioxygenase family)